MNTVVGLFHGLLNSNAAHEILWGSWRIKQTLPDPRESEAHKLKIITPFKTVIKTGSLHVVLTWCVPQAELNTLVFQLQTGCVVLKHRGDVRLETDKSRSQDPQDCKLHGTVVFHSQLVRDWVTVSRYTEAWKKKHSYKTTRIFDHTVPAVWAAVQTAQESLRSRAAKGSTMIYFVILT